MNPGWPTCAVIDRIASEAVAPVSGPRERAAATFQELYEGLALASQRHFKVVTAAYQAAG